jgi:nitrate/nitrite transporter NarK
MTSPFFVLLFSVTIFIICFACYTYFAYLMMKMATESMRSRKK